MSLYQALRNELLDEIDALRRRVDVLEKDAEPTTASTAKAPAKAAEKAAPEKVEVKTSAAAKGATSK